MPSVGCGREQGAVRCHAVIAESDSALAELYRIYLRREGYDVHLAADAQQCWGRLRDVQPAVLLLEWELHSGGGDGILSRLRDEWSGPQIQVIVTTTGDLDDVRLSGCDRFITLLRKPFALASLKSSLGIGASQRAPLQMGDLVCIARGPLRGLRAVLKSCEGDLWLIEPQSSTQDSIVAYRQAGLSRPRRATRPPWRSAARRQKNRVTHWRAFGHASALTGGRATRIAYLDNDTAPRDSTKNAVEG
jgi:CheY-like chemotaxis protein